jgi:hypothetical protein
MKIKIVLVFLFIALLNFDSFSQCAMCRASVETNLSEGRGAIGTGLNFGILYLLSAPYLLIAGLIFMWFRVGKKNLRAKIALDAQLSEIYNKKI